MNDKIFYIYNHFNPATEMFSGIGSFLPSPVTFRAFEKECLSFDFSAGFLVMKLERQVINQTKKIFRIKTTKSGPQYALIKLGLW